MHQSTIQIMNLKNLHQINEMPNTSTPHKSKQNFSKKITSENSLNCKATRFLGSKAVDILNNWFENNKRYPYPNEAIAESLAKLAGISVKQVKKWFANKRVRSQMCCKTLNKYKKQVI